MAMQTDNAQTTLLGVPATGLEDLRQAWSRASEPERMAFMEEIQRRFLFRNKPSPAGPNGQRKQLATR